MRIYRRIILQHGFECCRLLKMLLLIVCCLIPINWKLGDLGEDRGHLSNKVLSRQGLFGISIRSDFLHAKYNAVSYQSIDSGIERNGTIGDKNGPAWLKMQLEKHKYKTSDLYIDGYVHSNSQVCKKSPVIVTLLVISAPSHRIERAYIRKGWGKQTKDVVVVFFVGVTLDRYIQLKVKRESEEFGDLVINNNLDLYDNLSLKVISGFNWMLRFCPQSEYLLKVDEDMFVHVENLVKFIKSMNGKEIKQKLIFGNLKEKRKPVRDPKSKWYISSAEYESEYFPTYVSGPSYLLSRAVVKEIVPFARASRYLFLEDVFITGVVAESIGVKRKHIDEFENNGPIIYGLEIICEKMKSIITTKVVRNYHEVLHKLANDSISCKTVNKPANHKIEAIEKA